MRLKDSFAFFFSMIIFFSVISAAAERPSLSIDPSDITVIFGREFTLDVKISDVEGLFGASLDIEYNGNILQHVITDMGGFLGTDTIFLPMSEVNVINIPISMKRGQTPANGSGTIATITFFGKAEGTSQISFRRETLTLQKNDGEAIPVTTNNGAVTVIDKILSVQASRRYLPADGGSQALITATVSNTSGDPLSGQNVSMMVTRGAGTISHVTDVGNGIYTATYTASTQVGKETITVTIAAASESVDITLRATEIMLIIPEVFALPGTDVTVPIRINDAAGITKAVIGIDYDTDILLMINGGRAEVTDLSMGWNINLHRDSIQSGKIQLEAMGDAPIAGGSGPLINIVFRVNSSAQMGMEAPIEFWTARIYDENGMITPVNSQDGKVTIGINSSHRNTEFHDLDARILNSKSMDENSASLLLRPKFNALLQNFPNPFNPDTWIPYQIKEDSEVIIKIYTATGQLLKELNLGNRPAGSYATKNEAVYWNGKNESGEQVTSGIYFYTIQAGDFNATKRMMIMK